MSSSGSGGAVELASDAVDQAATLLYDKSRTALVRRARTMNRILAGAVGLALTNAIFHTLREHHTFAFSLANSFWVPVGVAAIGVVLTWAFVRSAPAPAAPLTEHHLHHRRFHL